METCSSVLSRTVMASRFPAVAVSVGYGEGNGACLAWLVLHLTLGLVPAR